MTGRRRAQTAKAHGFDGPVLVLLQDDGVNVQVVEERVYTATQGDSWRIPAGFRTDFATIPDVVSWAVAKLGAYSLAAIVHDLLCEGLNRWHAARAERGPDGKPRRIHPDGLVVPRPTASAVDTDAIFRRIARDHGVDRVTASLLWVGVRWGALGNAARRKGFMTTFWPWLGLSLAFAPVLLPATVLAVVGRAVLRVARLVVR